MLLSDLQSASFRGAPFLVPTDDTDEGRNAVTHEYPDASFRYVEDNGLIPPCFSITACLHGKGLKGQLSRLRRALNTPGPGVLQHPHYGTQFVQVDGTYTVHREDSDSGVVKVDIKFAVTGPPRFPGLVSGVAAFVTGLAGSAVASLFARFVSVFGSPSSNRSAKVQAGALKDLASHLDGAFGQATSAPLRILSTPEAYVRDVDRLSPLLIDSFRVPFDDRTLSNGDLVSKFDSVFDATDFILADAALISTSTRDLSERRDGLETLAIYTEAAAFASMADAMAGRAYDTAERVEFDEILLTSRFETTQSRELPADLHEALANIYVAASEVLRDTNVRLPRTEETDAKNTPASVLAYELYENNGLTNALVEDRVWQLVELNLAQDPILFSGDTTVLIEG